MRKIIFLLLFLFTATNAFAWYGDYTGSTIITGQLTSDAGKASTPVSLSVDTTRIHGVMIAPLPTNSGRVYIGSAARLTSSEGFVLAVSSDPIVIPTDHFSDIQMITESAGQGVSWIAVY